MKTLMASLYESLLDDEEEVMNKTKLVPLMKIIDAKNKKDYNNIYDKIADQFNAYKENKLYIHASSMRKTLDLDGLKNDDIIIVFDGMGGIDIGYKDFRKQSIHIFFSPQADEVVVSLGSPMSSHSIPYCNKGSYKLPNAYKEDFEKIVKKHQNGRKDRIL